MEIAVSSESKERSKATWESRFNEIAHLLGLASILYGVAVCVLSYFPTTEQRGTVIVKLIPCLNIAAVFVGFFLTLSTTYVKANSRPATWIARRIFAPSLFFLPLAIGLVYWCFGLWPSTDILLGITLISVGISVLRTFVRSVDFEMSDF